MTATVNPANPVSYSCYTESSDASGHKAIDILSSTADPGSHAGNDSSSIAVSTRPVGSGDNTPGNADYGMTISAIKHNWTSPSTIPYGEVSGLQIVCRQSGPAPVQNSASQRSDCDGIQGNIYSVEGCGFVAGIEMTVGNLDPNNSFNTHKSLGFQLGAFNSDTFNDTAYGLVLTAETRSLTCGITVQESGTSTWSTVFQYVKANGTVQAALYNSGDFSTLGRMMGTTFLSYGTQVVGAQITGYGTPTGGSKLANFPGATATLVQTSKALAQLIVDLKTHGLLGA